MWERCSGRSGHSSWRFWPAAGLTTKRINGGYENAHAVRAGSLYIPGCVTRKTGSRSRVAVTGGAPADGMWVRPQTVPTELLVPAEEQTLPVLLGPEESVKVVYEGKRQIAAPGKKGHRGGKTRYVLGDLVLAEYPVYTANSVEVCDFSWCFTRVQGKYLLVYSRGGSML